MAHFYVIAFATKIQVKKYAKEQLFEQYYDKIYRYCYSILRNIHDAEDATQEIFMKALESKALLAIERKKALKRPLSPDKRWSEWKLPRGAGALA